MPKLFGSKLVGKEVKPDKLFPVSQWCYASELINNPGQRLPLDRYFLYPQSLVLQSTEFSVLPGLTRVVISVKIIK